MVRRSYKHWTPRYIVDRLAIGAYQLLNPDAPWLTPTATNILASWLQPTDRGCEWGSGRSTIWLAEKTAHLLSSENDTHWFQFVTRQLQQRHLANPVDYRLYDTGETTIDCEGDYVQAAGSLKPSSLDYVLVDGVSALRGYCALLAIETLRPGGLLVVDNAEWFLPRRLPSRAPHSRGIEKGCSSAEWCEFQDRIAGWRSIYTTSGISDTALWVKPHSSDPPISTPR